MFTFKFVSCIDCIGYKRPTRILWSFLFSFPSVIHSHCLIDSDGSMNQVMIIVFVCHVLSFFSHFISHLLVVVDFFFFLYLLCTRFFFLSVITVYFFILFSILWLLFLYCGKLLFSYLFAYTGILTITINDIHNISPGCEIVATKWFFSSLLTLTYYKTKHFRNSANHIKSNQKHYFFFLSRPFICFLFYFLVF